jgi:predicted TIM-barrel fold metal-dependent hydrolase
MGPDDHYLLISADCHGGGGLLDYRPYLPSRYHDEFDAWAATYEIPYEDLKGPDADRNWDNGRRLAELESEGIVAEVVFPNTIPPFFATASLADQPPPDSAAERDARWAGLQAHNRWMADFCADAPGRRAGMVQIMLDDIDAAAAEVRWAKDAGLRGGVLLPGAPPGSGLVPLYDPNYYEPLWRVCEELGMPVNHHSGSAAPATGDEPEDKVVLLLEVTWWAHRTFTHLLVSGAFERHPGLQLVLTEQGTAWLPEELARLDFFFDRMSGATASQEIEWGQVVTGRLSLRPSEYWARQCHVGSSFIRPAEVALRHQVGVDRIMWGSDYPHKEGCHPYTRDHLRASFAGVEPPEVAAMLGGNAAEVYDFDVDALRELADKVGPTVAEVDDPLPLDSLPADAQKCPALIGYARRDT